VSLERRRNFETTRLTPGNLQLPVHEHPFELVYGNERFDATKYTLSTAICQSSRPNKQKTPRATSVFFVVNIYNPVDVETAGIKFVVTNSPLAKFFLSSIAASGPIAQEYAVLGLSLLPPIDEYSISSL